MGVESGAALPLIKSLEAWGLPRGMGSRTAAALQYLEMIVADDIDGATPAEAIADLQGVIGQDGLVSVLCRVETLRLVSGVYKMHFGQPAELDSHKRAEFQASLSLNN